MISYYAMTLITKSIPSDSVHTVWHGVIFVREGIYKDAIFKFDLYIPDRYAVNIYS